ncbi:MAG TPA: NADH-quinone oxidoreductase subunit I [Thermoanaerobaculia bacterium]|nr:NADH-quinone oxidoreductase subunit I [Thermoanaerobaculia bacterium]
MSVTRVSPGVVKVERPKLTLPHRTYLPQILSGMVVTIRHLIRNLFNLKKLPIISYPEVKRVYSERFRGRHILTTREDGTTRCVACYMCSTACPAECITIEAGEDERTREKFPVRYDIDLLRCIFCGYCVDACPEDAIYMTRDYEMAIDTRARAVVGLRDLVVPPNFPTEPMGWRPYYGRIDKRGTAGGTGLGQPLREAPFEDDAPPNPDVYRGA